MNIDKSLRLQYRRLLYNSLLSYLQISWKSHMWDVNGLWTIAMAWIIGRLKQKNHTLYCTTNNLIKYLRGQPAAYLRSLGDFSWCCLLLLRLFFFSCFLDVPFPRNHGFDRFFDWPSVDLFVLREKSVRAEAKTRETARSDAQHVCELTFSENVLYGRSMGWVLAFSSSVSPYDQLFWIWNIHVQIQLSIMLTNLALCLFKVICYVLQQPNMLVQIQLKISINLSVWWQWVKTNVTFSKAHLSWVYSAYLLMKGSSLSGMIVLWWEKKSG